jgi:hypothetical protein
VYTSFIQKLMAVSKEERGGKSKIAEGRGDGWMEGMRE